MTQMTLKNLSIQIFDASCRLTYPLAPVGAHRPRPLARLTNSVAPLSIWAEPEANTDRSHSVALREDFDRPPLFSSASICAGALWALRSLRRSLERQ
jgi:hypothetical protein